MNISILSGSRSFIYIVLMTLKHKKVGFSLILQEKIFQNLGQKKAEHPLSECSAYYI